MLLILKNISKDCEKIDLTMFDKYFNTIEIFLKQNKNSHYSFYHLSIKESLSFHAFCITFAAFSCPSITPCRRGIPEAKDFKEVAGSV